MTELQAPQRRSYTAKAIFGLLLTVVMVAAIATTGSAENTRTPRNGELAAVSAGSVPQEKVRLIEFKVEPQRDSIAAGKTKFVVKNAGTEEHEFVIVRGDDPGALPTTSYRSVYEDQIPEADQIGELKSVPPGKAKSKTFTLSPGTYILFCNFEETQIDGTVLSHFATGMYTMLHVS